MTDTKNAPVLRDRRLCRGGGRLAPRVQWQPRDVQRAASIARGVVCPNEARLGASGRGGVRYSEARINRHHQCPWLGEAQRYWAGLSGARLVLAYHREARHRNGIGGA